MAETKDYRAKERMMVGGRFYEENDTVKLTAAQAKVRNVELDEGDKPKSAPKASETKRS